MERIEGKTYRELTLMCHLPNFKRINPNAKEQTRTMGHIHVLRPVQTNENPLNIKKVMGRNVWMCFDSSIDSLNKHSIQCIACFDLCIDSVDKQDTILNATIALL